MIGYEDVKCDDCGNSQWVNEEEGFLVCSCGGDKEINDIPKGIEKLSICSKCGLSNKHIKHGEAEIIPLCICGVKIMKERTIKIKYEKEEQFEAIKVVLNSIEGLNVEFIENGEAN